nr:hypothetical protein [uncultured Capnocytophaga sp.]
MSLNIICDKLAMNQKFVIDINIEKKECDIVPFVSYEVVKYIWGYIEEKFLVPEKIWINDKFTYHFSIVIEKMEEEDVFFQENWFNTEKTKYLTPKFSTSKESRYTTLFITSGELSKDMDIRIFSCMLYNVLSSIVLTYTKKLSIDDFVREREYLDFNFISTFPYPASIESSKYIIE